MLIKVVFVLLSITFIFLDCPVFISMQQCLTIPAHEASVFRLKTIDQLHCSISLNSVSRNRIIVSLRRLGFKPRLIAEDTAVARTRTKEA